MPLSASEAFSRSSEMVRTELATLVCRSAASDAPLSGKVGKLLLVICRFSNTTTRLMRSTCVRAVANITPKVSCWPPLGMKPSAERNVIWLPCHWLTCGWYISTVPLARFTWRGQGSAGRGVADDGSVVAATAVAGAVAGVWACAAVAASAAARAARRKGWRRGIMTGIPVH